MSLVAIALVAHGVFDAFHADLITNPGVPAWWPASAALTTLSQADIWPSGLTCMAAVMMAFEENALVRHANMPSWGIGRILKVDGELVWIQFSGAGLKKLKVDIAAEHLVAADLVVTPESKAPVPRPITSAGSRSSSRSDARCAHCDQLLKRSQQRNAGTMKSCPNCSGFEGEHVFYPYPEGFAAAVGSAKDAARDHSDCSQCRSNAPLPHSGGTYCSKLADAS